MRRSPFDDDPEPKTDVKKHLRKERLANPAQLTTFTAVSSVIEIMTDSGLDIKYLHMAEPYLKFLAQPSEPNSLFVPNLLLLLL